MSDLKTLKDIPWKLGDFTLSASIGEELEGSVAPLFKYQDDLRAEAKKWIKELRENPEGYVDIFSEWVEGNSKPDAFLVRNFIKRFFNISEEELREEK